MGKKTLILLLPVWGSDEARRDPGHVIQNRECPSAVWKGLSNSIWTKRQENPPSLPHEILEIISLFNKTPSHPTSRSIILCCLCTKKLLPQRRGLCILDIQHHNWYRTDCEQYLQAEQTSQTPWSHSHKGGSHHQGAPGLTVPVWPTSPGYLQGLGSSPGSWTALSGQVPLDFSFRLAMSPTTLTFFKSVGQLWDFPGGQLVKTLGFQMQGTKVWPLAGKLRSHMSQGAAPPRNTVGQLFCTMSLPLALSNTSCWLNSGYIRKFRKYHFPVLSHFEYFI